MVSGTINGSTSNGYISAKIEWSSVPDPANGKSVVTAALYYKRSNDYTTSGTGTFSIKIGTKTTSTTKYLAINTSWVKAVEATETISHNADGKKSVLIEAAGIIPGSSLEYTTCSKTVELEVLPRPTLIDSLKCSSSYFDGTFTYEYTPRSSYYTRAEIILNNAGSKTLLFTVNLGQKTAGIQYYQTFTFSSEQLSTIYSKLANTASAKIRVELGTYWDSGCTVLFDMKQYKEISLTIPVGIKPKASLTVSPVNTKSWIAGKGIYVAGYTGLMAGITDAEAGEGASISSYAISGGGYSSNTGELNVDKISASGNITLTGSVKDSRGRSATPSQTITVQPYSVPSINRLTVMRGTYDASTMTPTWTPDDNGSDVKVVLATSLSLTDYGNRYAAGFYVDDKLTIPSYSGFDHVNCEPATEYSFYLIGVDSEKSHSLKITATDGVGETTTATITIPTTYVTIEFNESGKGIAFGKTSEKDAFECAMVAEFSGGVIFQDDNGVRRKIVFNSDGTCSWTSA